MKISLKGIAGLFFSVVTLQVSAQTGAPDSIAHKKNSTHLYIDVHQLQPGNVKFEDVAKAHQRDLAVENKYDVRFLKYWVDEEKGLVYCLSSAHDSASIVKTHAEAHGLLPEHVYRVTDGAESAAIGQKNLYLDVHYLGAGNVNAKAVDAAHQKDLAVEGKYGVNFLNYWVNEKEGVVMCLAEAKDSASIAQTHKEAHGLMPAEVMQVKQGK